MDMLLSLKCNNSSKKSVWWQTEIESVSQSSLTQLQVLDYRILYLVCPFFLFSRHIYVSSCVISCDWQSIFSLFLPIIYYEQEIALLLPSVSIYSFSIRIIPLDNLANSCGCSLLYVLVLIDHFNLSSPYTLVSFV